MNTERPHSETHPDWLAIYDEAKIKAMMPKTWERLSKAGAIQNAIKMIGQFHGNRKSPPTDEQVRGYLTAIEPTVLWMATNWGSHNGEPMNQEHNYASVHTRLNQGMRSIVETELRERAAFQGIGAQRQGPLALEDIIIASQITPNWASSEIRADALMTEHQLRRYAGMRAMSNDEMAKRQREMLEGTRNAWPGCIDHARGQAAMQNTWSDAADLAKQPTKPKQTLWGRIIKALKFSRL